MSRASWVGKCPVQVGWERVPSELGGNLSHQSWVGTCLVRVEWEIQYSFQMMRSLCQEECEADASIILRSRCQNECDADATRSHPTCMGHFPTQLARDTFPPNSDGTRSHLTPSHSHPTPTGHVPTQLARNNFPPNSHGTRLRSRCQNECEADVRMNAKPMS